MQIKYKYWLVIFVLTAFANLYHAFHAIYWLQIFAKPLICISLAAFFYLNTRMATRFEKFILLGLGFSCLGDIFLMFQNKSEWYFILGLASFLICHFMYLKAFLFLSSQNTGFLKRNKWPMFLVGIFFLANVIFYWTSLTDTLLIPFICYCLAISLMLLASIHVYGDIPVQIWRLIFSGAILFIISDSLIALSKFKAYELGNAHFWIMTTYMASQLLICYGSLKASIYCRFDAKDSISSSLKNLIS